MLTQKDIQQIRVALLDDIRVVVREEVPRAILETMRKEVPSMVREIVRTEISDVRGEIQAVEERLGNRIDRAIENIIAERRSEIVR